MAEHGIENFICKDLDTIENEADLNAAEIENIEIFDSCNKGYNMTSGGGSKYQHAPESIELMKKVKRENLDANRHPVLAGMPPCVTYDEKKQEIKVARHPLCKFRLFSLATYGTVAAQAAACREFVQHLEETGEVYVPTKRDKSLNQYPGIFEEDAGYAVSKQIRNVTYKQRFTSRNNTKEVNKQLAIDYYNDTIVPLIPRK